MRLRIVFELLKDAFNGWSEDKAPRMGAALAYYTIFSLAPLLIIAIGIAGLIFGERAARGEIVGQIEGTIGSPAAQAIQEMLKDTHTSRTSVPATVIGLVVLLFGASGVFVELHDALNTIWKVEPKPGRALMTLVRERFLSFTVVLGTGFLLLVSLVISAALAAVSKFLTPDALPGGVYLWQALNALIALGFITLLFGLMYKLLPDVKIAWRDVWVGAFVSSLLFTVGKYLLGWYLGQGSTASSFGAAGSLVVVLIWVYYSAQILLFGAEFCRVYALKHGSSVVPADNAISVAPECQTRQGTPPREAAATPSQGR
jgi:membrane protein